MLCEDCFHLCLTKDRGPVAERRRSLMQHGGRLEQPSSWMQSLGIESMSSLLLSISTRKIVWSESARIANRVVKGKVLLVLRAQFGCPSDLLTLL